MEEKETRESLFSLSIYQLRNKARDMGVKSPTAKRQQQLIEEILKIQNGEMSAYKSNMGRPPKNKAAQDVLNGILSENLAAKANYEHSVISQRELCLADAVKNSHTFEFMGVVRIGNGQKKYVNNYLGGKKYVLLEGMQNPILEGDLVFGTAKEDVGDFGIVVECKKCNFNKSSSKSKKDQLISTFETYNDMYNFVKSHNSPNKIVVEAETNGLPYASSQGEMFLYTNECADIVETYNMLLDVKNAVNRATENNINFCLYLLNAEYLYSMISMYFSANGQNGEVNAGQIFKELLSLVESCPNASVVVMQKEKSPRNSYLDIILNKYCTKI